MAMQQARWFRIDWALVLYGLKMTVAALLALAISFWSNLPQPYWSVITVAVLANPNADQVTAKSIARVVGTLLGAAYSLLLVEIFGDHGVMFLGALCLWLGICVWFSAWFRDSEAYAFALAGYTATIVGLPAGLDPASAFETATGRASQVGIGIAVTWIASVLFFPRFSHVDFPVKVRTAGAKLARCLSAGADGAEARVQLATLFTTLHGYGRSLSLGGPGARRRVIAIRSMNIAIMRALFLSSALASPDRRRPELDELASGLQNALSSEAAAAEAQTQWEEAARRLEHEVRNTPRHSSGSDTTVLWLRFVQQCCQMLIGYRALYNPSITPIPVRGRFHMADADGLLASISALQAMMSFAIIAAFWLATGWETGVSALIIASVYTLRLSSKLHAIGAYRMMAWVVVICTVPALALSFQVLPMLEGFPALALALAPYLLAAFMVGGLGGPYGPMAILITLVLMVVLQPENATTYNFDAAINGILATMLSFFICAAVSQIVVPTSPWLLRLRLIRASARTLRRATSDSVDAANEAETRLTFLASEIAPEFHKLKPDPYRETEAAFVTGLATIALARLHDGVQHEDAWAQSVRVMQDKARRLQIWHWHKGLEELVSLAVQGGEEARACIEPGGDGRACQAAASFQIFQQSVGILSGISLQAVAQTDLMTDGHLKTG